jgi:hypothetical protein
MLTSGLRLAGEHEKRGLKSIFGIMPVVQDMPADAEHERPMPPHERLERRRIAPRREMLEELIVRQMFRPDEMPNAAQDSARLYRRHVHGPRWKNTIVPV